MIRLLLVVTVLTAGCAKGDKPCGIECRPDAAPPPDAPPSSCGDAVRDPEEVCDDGFTDACGTCNADCTGPGTGTVCGDGAVCAETETCDDGFTDACGSCNATCTGAGTGATCGDLSLCPELEACDDGYTDACGTCNADCTGAGTGAVCGDGIPCPQVEACDDGYTDACGTCNADCTGAGSGSICGDAVICPEAETCDVGPDGCHACADDCKGTGTGPMCGDGDWCPTTEQCDDGNSIPDDGCDNQCVGTCGPNPIDISAMATPSSSGGGVESTGYGPSRMNDTHYENECGSFFFHWVTAGSSPSTEWIQYTWSSAQQVGRIAIDTQLASSGTCSSSGRNLAGGTVQWWNGSSWVTAGTVSAQTGDWQFVFPQVVTTTMIRIYGVHTSNTGQGSNPMIFEWDVYSCP